LHFQLWLAFVATSAVLLVIPGPTILMVISFSVANGRRAILPLVGAVSLGDSTSLLLSILGLGALLATAAFWFTAIKWVGGLYLIYLGLRLFRAGFQGGDRTAPEGPCTRWHLFANTYLVTALNPKAIVFFVAVLPQFVSPAAAPGRQLLLLGCTFVAMAGLNAALYALFASAASRLLASPRAQRRFNLAGGSILSAAGILALLARRAA
jgi:threonine/homoserine/homoserine lactone efflux protein